MNSEKGRTSARSWRQRQRTVLGGITHLCQQRSRALLIALAVTLPIQAVNATGAILACD